MSMNAPTQFALIKERFPSLSGDSTERQYRWLLALLSLMQLDNAFTDTHVLPFVDMNLKLHELLLKLVEEQSELSVVALRVVALHLVLTSRMPSSVFHDSLTRSDAEFVPVLLSIGKANDPMLNPSLLMALQALCLGPSAVQFATLLASCGSDALQLALRLMKSADHFSTGTLLLDALMTTKEGVKLCQTKTEDVSVVVAGTQLGRSWTLVKGL